MISLLVPVHDQIQVPVHDQLRLVPVHDHFVVRLVPVHDQSVHDQFCRQTARNDKGPGAKPPGLWGPGQASACP